MPHNPYKALAHEGLVKYYRVNSHSKDSIWQSENLKLLDYRVYAHLENEMQIRYCKILDRASENESIKFSQRESYLLEYLNFARAIGCRAEEISALWGIYLLYDEAKEAPSDGQEQLKAAYDLARTDSDYKETPNYCWMLQVMIDYYKGAIDKKAIYRELKEIAPGIFGSDVRRKRIYRCLENYASQAGDAEAIDFEVECLRCEFDQWELGRAYDACVKFADEARFLVELEKVLREMPKITTKEETIIEEFLKDIVDSYNRQKELEKRFDELFGNALKNSAKSDEVDADSNKSNPLTSDTDNKLNVDSSEFVKEVRETVRHVKQEKERERFAWVQSKRRISTL